MHNEVFIILNENTNEWLSYETDQARAEKELDDLYERLPAGEALCLFRAILIREVKQSMPA